MQESSSRQEQVPLISEGELCLDLINSEHFDYRGRRGVQDNLTNPEWVAAFAQHWRLPVTSPPDALALATLRALRALLRQMFEAAAAGQPVTDAQLEELNAFCAGTVKTKRLSGSRRGKTTFFPQGRSKRVSRALLWEVSRKYLARGC